MGLKLFTFAYNTLLQQANKKPSGNEPPNKLFLPVVLAGMRSSSGETYLPIKEDSWSIDSISDASTLSSAFAITWFAPFFQNASEELKNEITTNKLTTIACPGSAPSLQVSDLEILGLSNIKVSGSPPKVTKSDEGYQFTVILDTNAYTNTGDNWNQQLALGGTQSGTDTKTDAKFMGLGFKLTQSLCFAKSSDTSVCVPLPQGVEEPQSPNNPSCFSDIGSGQAHLNINDAKIIADVTISVAADNKSLAVSINELVFQGQSSTYPTYDLQNLAIDYTEETKAYVSVWTTFVTNILGTPDVAKSFSSQVNSALNSSDNKSVIESTLNQQLGDALDSLLGAQTSSFTPKSGDTNPVDQYVFHRVRDALNNPKSILYIPKVVIGSTSPVLEPYKTSSINIPGSYTTTFVGVSATVSEIQFPSGLTVAGASNLIAPSENVIFTEDAVNSTLELGRLNPGPTIDGKIVPNPPLTTTSTFSLMVSIAGNKPVGPITGSITIKTEPNGNSSSLPAIKSSLNASGSDPESLEMTFESISLDVDTDEVKITITLDGGSEYEAMVNAVANNADLKNQVLTALNEEISKELPEISKQAETFCKEQLNNLGTV